MFYRVNPFEKILEFHYPLSDLDLLDNKPERGFGLQVVICTFVGFVRQIQHDTLSCVLDVLI